jgi:uncharacterized protein (DUF433 family)
VATQEGARIVSTPDVLGDDPRIQGRRIGVYFVHERVEGRGLSPQTVADRHDLDVAAYVYRALAYYHEHLREMAEIRRRRRRRLDEAADEPDVATVSGGRRWG